MLSREQMADMMFDCIFEQSKGSVDLEREGLQNLVEQCLREIEIHTVESLLKRYRPAWTVDEIPDLRAHPALARHLYKPIPCDLQWLYGCLMAHPDTRSLALRQAGTKYPVEALGLTPGIQAPHIDLSWLNAPHIDLSGANLSGADLSNTRLVRANLSGANLSGANLRYADLRSANLTGANLSNADLSSAQCHHTRFTHANLDGASLTHADLTGAGLTHASLNRTLTTNTRGL
jgi:hypothetical protein